MGCDIHVHTEVKINGVWHHYSIPRVRRNYMLFGKMAGVRNRTVDPISLPKGLPEDATFLTEFDSNRYGSDGHSHSWLSSEEVNQLSEWWLRIFTENLSEDFGWFFGNSWAGFIKYREEYRPEIEDFRFVFWFDN